MKVISDCAFCRRIKHNACNMQHGGRQGDLALRPERQIAQTSKLKTMV